MSNFIRLTKIILVLCLFFVGVDEIKAETIDSFTAEYNIKQDASVEVSETIVYDFGKDNRHGIYRTLSKKHAQGPTAWYKNRLVEIDLLSVTRDGKAESFSLYDYGDELEIKIGNPDKTITPDYMNMK